MRPFRALSRPLGASLPSRSSEACIINTFGFDLRLSYFGGSDSSQPLNEKIQRRIYDQKSSGTGDIEEILTEAVPQAKQIGVLWNPTTPSHPPAVQAVKGATEKLGVHLLL